MKSLWRTLPPLLACLAVLFVMVSIVENGLSRIQEHARLMEENRDLRIQLQAKTERLCAQTLVINRRCEGALLRVKTWVELQ